VETGRGQNIEVMINKNQNINMVMILLREFSHTYVIENVADTSRKYSTHTHVIKTIQRNISIISVKKVACVLFGILGTQWMWVYDLDLYHAVERCSNVATEQTYGNCWGVYL